MTLETEVEYDPLTDIERVIVDRLDIADHTLNFQRAVLGAHEIAQLNVDGIAVRHYDVSEDESGYIFGDIRIKFLKKPGTNEPFEDDPLFPLRDASQARIPVAKLLDYLRDWYHPKVREMKAAREVSA